MTKIDDIDVDENMPIIWSAGHKQEMTVFHRLLAKLKSWKDGKKRNEVDET